MIPPLYVKECSGFDDGWNEQNLMLSSHITPHDQRVTTNKDVGNVTYFMPGMLHILCDMLFFCYDHSLSIAVTTRAIVPGGVIATTSKKLRVNHQPKEAKQRPTN